MLGKRISLFCIAVAKKHFDREHDQNIDYKKRMKYFDKGIRWAKLAIKFGGKEEIIVIKKMLDTEIGA